MCCNDAHHGPGEHHEPPEQTGEVIERLGRPTLAAGDLNVHATAVGPSPAALSAIARGLTTEWLAHDAGSSRLRLLSLRVLDADKDCERGGDRFLAHVYDYANGRTLRVCGPVDRPERASVEDTALQPLPTDDEFAAALDVLANRSEHGAALRSGELLPYQPMPPLSLAETPDGRVERTIVVGLTSRNDRGRHLFAGVNLHRDEVVTTLDHVARDVHDECGPPAAGGCADTGQSGRASIAITSGGTTLWNFDAVRPAASSGTNGSGIELRGVRYRGKQVLYQAHVPILNIEYANAPAGCGPTYRDWQNGETCFQANGSDPLPGFRLCSTPAQTIVDNGSDAGNFRGVAIYVQGAEVVLVSELQAGWYRYVSQWRFGDGTIRPRFGFAAVNNPCTCKDHHHHAYWRLDFDIRTAASNVVEEFNDPVLVGSSNWHTKRYEIRRPRDASRKRHWRVRNQTTGEGYTIRPGANDGSLDAYGAGDLWVLRYRGSEIDDGQGFTTDPALSRAHIDRFVSGEVVEDRDVVIWYAAHFRHSPGHGPALLGPDLAPFNW